MVLPTNAAARFSVLGPVLTVTLKDPEPSSFSSSEGSGGGEKWLNLNNLRPNLLWSIESRSKPLPNWLPSLTSLKANLGYQYDARFKNVPSYVEADAKFHEPKTNLDLQIQPSYDFRSRRASWLVQLLSNQKAYLMAKLGSGGSGGQANKKQAKWLQLIRACYQLDLPYASVGAVRATPTWNLQTGEPSCVLEGMTGSQRTKAVLNLEYQNPTLTVVHSVSDRHVISPEISLYNARIVYQWNIRLDSGSIRTQVDPTSAVHVTWTDKSMTGNWVTDFRLPLAGTTLSALAADVRVRRQFSF